jgi:hypothetical protein
VNRDQCITVACLVFTLLAWGYMRLAFQISQLEFQVENLRHSVELLELDVLRHKRALRGCQ